MDKPTEPAEIRARHRDIYDAAILLDHRDFILEASLKIALARHMTINPNDPPSPVDMAAQLVYDFDDLVSATRAGRGLRAGAGGTDQGEVD